METIKTYDYESFRKLISSLKDTTVFDRIRFFGRDDISWYEDSSKPYFMVLTINNKIVGMAKIGYYKSDGGYCLSFLSIDIKHRNKGYCRIIADEMFRFLKEKNLDLRTSSYTFVGKTKMQHILNECAVKHDVLFIDKKDTDSLIDAEYMYDENLIHKNEKYAR